MLIKKKPKKVFKSKLPEVGEKQYRGHRRFAQNRMVDFTYS